MITIKHADAPEEARLNLVGEIEGITMPLDALKGVLMVKELDRTLEQKDLWAEYLSAQICTSRTLDAQYTRMAEATVRSAAAQERWADAAEKQAKAITNLKNILVGLVAVATTLGKKDRP